MMKVTVTKFLNVRVGSPGVNAPCYQYLAPGSEIEVEDQVYKGEPYDGIDLWYRDLANNYYWKGGAEEIKPIPDTQLFAATDSQLDWYHREYRLPEIWDKFKTQGEGVRIAVIDSGIAAEHPCFKNSKISGYNYLAANGKYMDNHGHGSMVAGIICGCGPDLIGVAPKAEVFAAKIYDEESPTSAAIADALKQLPSDIRIVVISQNFIEARFTKDGLTLQQLKEIFSNSDKILCCSTGNKGNHHTLPTNLLPASIGTKNILSVAAIGKNQTIYRESCKSNFVTLAAPGELVKVVSLFPNNPTTILSGTSYSAPFAAGILALIISRNLKQGKFITNNQAIDLLLKNVSPAGDPLLFGAGIINPMKSLT